MGGKEEKECMKKRTHTTLFLLAGWGGIHRLSRSRNAHCCSHLWIARAIGKCPCTPLRTTRRPRSCRLPRMPPPERGAASPTGSRRRCWNRRRQPWGSRGQSCASVCKQSKSTNQVAFVLLSAANRVFTCLMALAACSAMLFVVDDQ